MSLTPGLPCKNEWKIRMIVHLYSNDIILTMIIIINSLYYLECRPCYSYICAWKLKIYYWFRSCSYVLLINMRCSWDCSLVVVLVLLSYLSGWYNLAGLRYYTLISSSVTEGESFRIPKESFLSLPTPSRLFLECFDGEAAVLAANTRCGTKLAFHTMSF